MQTKMMFLSILTLGGAAALLCMTGCQSDDAFDEGNPYEDGTQIQDVNGWDNAGENAMPGASFADLPRVDVPGIQPVYFGYNNYQIPETEYPKIDTVADVLNRDDSIVLIVEGHCDERGTNEYNMSLGDYRAQTLRSHLINLGISADRIQTQSYGEEKPAVQGSGEEVWSQNRRGEFAFYKK